MPCACAQQGRGTKSEIRSILEHAAKGEGPPKLGLLPTSIGHEAGGLTRARAADRTIGMADGLIAASAAVRNLTVATRDTGPFEAAGLPAIDPWRVRSEA